MWVNTVDADGSGPGHLTQSYRHSVTVISTYAQCIKIRLLLPSAGDQVTNSSIWIVWKVILDICFLLKDIVVSPEQEIR